MLHILYDSSKELKSNFKLRSGYLTWGNFQGMFINFKWKVRLSNCVLFFEALIHIAKFDELKVSSSRLVFY